MFPACFRCGIKRSNSDLSEEKHCVVKFPRFDKMQTLASAGGSRNLHEYIYVQRNSGGMDLEMGLKSRYAEQGLF